MAFKTLNPFPIFAPPNPNHHLRPATEVRFSRWNNANADKFTRPERTLKEIEDELRFLKRYDSAQKIAYNYNDATTAAGDSFRSTGTPSTPSRPSIPGKSSKYSKTPKTPSDSHPAFRRFSRIAKVPNDSPKSETDVKISQNGVSYVIPNAPFEFQYSYTETPKEKPIKLREPPIAPFGPSTMPRPWTGRKPLPPSKKKLKEFDSFQLPPPHKKGVKPVQAPGPFLPGSGPKYVRSREEILGEPLTKEETELLIKGCMKSKRQLNMGRDGLTHNMLDNIHALWKRKRVCKIKCKGVCTVDMDNVRQQLEEKTGGKIIYSKGGVIYLFRGRNYNYKTHPRFPLMLWKPVTPVYPRLIQRAPEDLTLEEATDMRKRGRNLTPICKLGKNGVYNNLVNNVKEAFEACELVRIDCQGMNGSDFRKIGAKLKDQVPCVLISFEREHILMWRGRDWKSSITVSENEFKHSQKSKTDVATSLPPPLQMDSVTASTGPDLLIKDANISVYSQDITIDVDISNRSDMPLQDISAVSIKRSEGNSEVLKSETILDTEARNDSEAEPAISIRNDLIQSEPLPETEPAISIRNDPNQSEPLPEAEPAISIRNDPNQSEPLPAITLSGIQRSSWMEGVESLLKKAVESGSAVVLGESNLDADIVYQKAVALAQSAPPGPVFRRQYRKAAAVQKSGKWVDQTREKEEAVESEVKEASSALTVPEKRGSERNYRTRKFKEIRDEDLGNIVPKGSLRVDELAKLLL